MENQLVQIINESGLDKTKGQILLENFSNYFEVASEWEKKANELEVTSITQVAEMKLAREGRLILRDKRVTVEKTRKALKENALREGQTIDAIAKILTNLIEPIEKNLEQKEKFAEIQEAKRIEELRKDREDEASKYREYIPFGIDLGKIDDESWSKLLTGAKLQLEQKEEAERKAEQERILREKAEMEERERQKAENERLKKEAEERERQLSEERAKADAERREIEEKARIEREEQNRLLAIEREKQVKLEAELKAKADAEKQAKLEAERIASEEHRKREDDERRSKNAPDKEKLVSFLSDIENLPVPEMKSTEGIVALNITLRELATVLSNLKLKIEQL